MSRLRMRLCCEIHISLQVFNVTNAALTPSAICSIPLVIIRFTVSVQLVSNNLFPYHDGDIAEEIT
jgi:hypothetical protein